MFTRAFFNFEYAPGVRTALWFFHRYSRLSVRILPENTAFFVDMLPVDVSLQKALYAVVEFGLTHTVEEITEEEIRRVVFRTVRDGFI